MLLPVQFILALLALFVGVPIGPAMAKDAPAHAKGEIALPSPVGNPGSWVSTSDYPHWAVNNGLTAFVDFELTVAPDGKVADCIIRQVDGDPRFGPATCEAIEPRAKFNPAHDTAGNAHFGTWRSRVKWFHNRVIGEWLTRKDIGSPSPADVALHMEQLPAGLDEPQDVRLALAVDGKGKVLACDRVNDSANENPQLLGEACAYARATGWPALQTSDGKFRPSIQSADFLFVTDDQAEQRGAKRQMDAPERPERRPGIEKKL